MTSNVKKIWALAGSALVAMAAFACSSSSNGGGGGASCLLSASGASSACESCINSACSDYFNCLCPGGTFNACNATTCMPSSACSMAEQSNTCTACTMQCSTTSGSSSGGTTNCSGS